MTETLLTADRGDGALIEDLARRAAESAAAPEHYALAEGSHIIARIERDDEDLRTYNLERWLDKPTRVRGAATLHSPDDFTEYVRRLSSLGLTVWGAESASRFTAVFNDHQDPAVAGWRDHTATLQLQSDPDWNTFMQRDGSLTTQQDFAEFLQDYAAVFIEPDAATLLEIAVAFRAHRKANFSSAIDLDTKTMQLEYTEEVRQDVSRAGEIPLPKTFTVALTPWLGYPPVQVAGRLRWDIEGGHLRIGFKLHRPDVVKRDAFEEIRTSIRTALNPDDLGYEVPVLLGTPPGAIAPQQ
ncbi:hypothetical protein GCM10027258_63010 [Amycolatopsis stemonae]